MINHFFTKKSTIMHTFGIVTKDGESLDFSCRLNQLNKLIFFKKTLPLKDGNFYLKIANYHQGQIEEEDLDVLHQESFDKELGDRNLIYFLLIAVVKDGIIFNYFGNINYYRYGGHFSSRKSEEEYGVSFINHKREIDFETNSVTLLSHSLVTELQTPPALKRIQATSRYGSSYETIEEEVVSEIEEIYSSEDAEEDDIKKTIEISNVGAYDENRLVYLPYCVLYPEFRDITVTLTDKQREDRGKDIYGENFVDTGEDD